MKKIVTLCLFAFALILCTQTTQAQAKVAANSTEAATQKTKELASLFKLDKNAINNAYEIFSTHEKKSESLTEYFKIGTKEYNKNKEELKESLIKQLSDGILSPDQIKRYLIVLEQNQHRKKKA